MLSIKPSESSRNLVDNFIGEREFECEPRVNPFKNLGEEDVFPLVSNGNLIYSYIPKVNHYFFSKVPNNKFFNDYYLNHWCTSENIINKKSYLSNLKSFSTSFLPSWKDAYGKSNMIFNKNSPLKMWLSTLDKIQSAIGIKNKAFINNWNHCFIHGQYDLFKSFLLFRPYLKKDSIIFDLGGGDGSFLQPYIDNGFECYLLEPCPITAERANLRGINVINCQLESQDDKDRISQIISKSDLIISNHSLEHHFDPNNLFNLCNENMKEDSILGITVPNADASFLFMDHVFPLHLDNYTEFSLTALANNHGFNVLQKEISHQLRFLFSKKYNLSCRDKINFNHLNNDLNIDHFRFEYSKKLEYQLRSFALSKENHKQDSNTFEISLNGARPFLGMNYGQNGENDDPTTLERIFSIELSQSKENLITYLTNNKLNSFVVLK